MSSFRELSNLGIVPKLTEVRIRTAEVEFQQTLTIDKSLVCEYTGNVSISGDLAITGTLVLPSWDHRKYLEAHSGALDAPPLYYPFVMPYNCYIRTIRSVVSGDPGAAVAFSLYKTDPFLLSTATLTIANGAAAGETDSVNLDWTDANDKTIMTCLAGDHRAIGHFAFGAANPVFATFVLELSDSPT